MTESVEGGILEVVVGGTAVGLSSGVVKERAVAEATEAESAQHLRASRRCRPGTTHRVKRVNISRRALRVVVVVKESRETTKEHTRGRFILAR